MKTELKDRVLWFDGTSEVEPELVPELLLDGVPISNIVVTRSNDDVEKFNSLADEQLVISKAQNDKLSTDWKTPESYLQLELRDYITEKLKLLNLPAEQLESYLLRADNELTAIKAANMTELFQTLIYVVDTLRQSKTVWGVGRGSSCASLILFLIGLHSVDPVKHKIPMTEFFHQ